MTTTARELRDDFETRGQGHVFDYLERLDETGREQLTAQLRDVDLALVGELAQLAKEPPATGGEHAFDPPELFPLERDEALGRTAEAARERGREALVQGKVGYVLVAGGQSSRLGYDAPKGAFPVGPVTECTLFEFHAHRLRHAQAVYGAATPWYVMTSHANDAATRQIFAEHAFFGLNPEDVFFFAQDMLPALDSEGRILFSAPDSLFLAPNGHGGSLLGLARSGALTDMRRRGVEEISYFQVDNPLVRPVDPLFLGLHLQAGAGMSSKVVAKRDASEKVGVLGRMDGSLGCIEYSDLPPALREERDATGELRFRAGNIGVHLIGVPFVEELTRDRLELPWHVARKNMRTALPDGSLRDTGGFKFETFVFDALARTRSSVTLEVDRAHEFSPVKNKTGEDSPATARADLCKLFATWVRAAGGTLPEPDSDGNRPVEVDPLLAESQDEFLAHGRLEPDVRETGHFYA